MDTGKLVILILVLISSAGCEKQPGGEETEYSSQFDFLVDKGEITGSLNPFALIENPDYTNAHEIDYIRDDELVLVSKACGLVLAYPHNMMSVEVVNEYAHGVAVAITYCPITRSGIQWDRIIGSDTLLLTASGYLLKDNLMPYDVKSESIWSQMLLSGLHGKHEDEEIRTLPLVETTWKTLKDFYPNAGVFTNSVGLKSSFESSMQDPESSIEVARSPLPQVYGILDRTEVKAYTLDLFPGELGLISTSLQSGGKIVVAGSSTHHYIVSFMTDYPMEPVTGEFPIIMRDETGTRWTIFGEAVSGKRGGERLESPTAYSASDWAWEALFEKVRYYIAD